MVSLVVDVRVNISLLAVVVDSVAVVGVVVLVGAGGGVVVASVIVVLVVFSVVFLDFVAIVVAAENSIGIFASRCIILHLDIAIPAIITELMLVNSPFSVVAGLIVVAAALVVNTCCIRNKNLTHGYLVLV